MPVPKSQDLPELFIPDDSRWASRAAARGEIRRLARGLYSTNLSEASARLVRRRWYDVAALYFPAAVDRSAAAAGRPRTARSSSTSAVARSTRAPSGSRA